MPKITAGGGPTNVAADPIPRPGEGVFFQDTPAPGPEPVAAPDGPVTPEAATGEAVPDGPDLAEAVEAPAGPERPADRAAKADWIAYVVALGVDPEWAEAQTKADLQAFKP